MERFRRECVMMAATLAMAVAAACAQTSQPDQSRPAEPASQAPANQAPASQAPANQAPANQAPTQDQWTQPPEGRAASLPQIPPNCSGSITSGDGKVEKMSTCAPPSAPNPAAAGAAQQFPYPGEAADKDAAPNAPAGAGAAAPNAAGTARSNAPAGQRFPYPGDPAAAGSSPALRDAGSSGESSSSNPSNSSSSSSSSSSSGSSSSGPENGGDAGPLGGDSDAPAAARRHRRKLPDVPRQSPSEREAEDLRVAGFYQSDGDYKGAYMRAKDAVSIANDDADAHLALAESARRLGKLDEAELNYRKCLSLDPVPKTRKTAEKALKEMTGGS